MDFTVRGVEHFYRMCSEPGMSTLGDSHTWTRQGSKQPDLTLKIPTQTGLKDEMMSSDSVSSKLLHNSIILTKS